jgi:chemotaxis protein MotB
LSRKKLKTSSPGSIPWLNTFADLMNLLLCFFVMLFAFSDINVEKFEIVSISMANSFGITKNTSDTDAQGVIGAGMVQLSELADYYLRIGDSDSSTTDATDNATDDTGTASDLNKEDADKAELDEAIARLDQKMEESTTAMYDLASDLTEQYDLTDYVELSIDPEYKFIELTLKGSVLYDSGEAEIRQKALPILNSIGRIIKKFEGYNVEITGHTDNVPMSKNSQYEDNNWLSTARALNAAQYLIEECNIDPATLKYSGRGEYDPIASNATQEGRAKNRRIEIKIYNEYSSE